MADQLDVSIAAAGARRAEGDFDLELQRAIEAERARRLGVIAANERTSLVVSNVLLLAAVFALPFLLASERSPSAATVLVLVAVYAATFRLDFEVGTGTAVPTQLVLVPMFFLLPAGIVPLAVLAGIVLATAVDVVRGDLHVARAFPRLTSGWHVLGPALVLGLATEGAPDLARWPLYAAALAAQFLVDAVSAIALEWATLRVPPDLQLRRMGWVYAIDAGLAPVGLAVAFMAADAPAAVVLVLPFVALLGAFSTERRVRIDNELALRDAYRGTAFLLGDVVEADDVYTGMHSRDVVDLTLAVADRLGLDSRKLRDAELAALLHDVGKVRVPKEIINKPGKLTPEERAVIETHTIEGERMLRRVGGLLGQIGLIVRSCHERYDGRGYPDGLAGEEIPVVARIVAACDAYNAMTTDRSYRKALPTEVAMEELMKNRGTQFDPAVVDVLVALAGRPG